MNSVALVHPCPAGLLVACVLVLLMMSLSPLVGVAAADDSILLQTDTQHVVLAPGQSTNVTLTVENNGSSIETYNITIDDGSLAMYWEILPVDDTLENVFPTWSKNTTIVVRLSEGATVADSGRSPSPSPNPIANSTAQLPSW